VRNTRINFTFNGSPVLGKLSPRGVIDADFFGALERSDRPTAMSSPSCGVRFAYADLTNGRTTVRIGQFWSPLFGEVPVSALTYRVPARLRGGGMIGWRYPGIFLYHDLAPGKPLAIQLQLAAFEGSGPAAAGDVAQRHRHRRSVGDAPARSAPSTLAAEAEPELDGLRRRSYRLEGHDRDRRRRQQPDWARRSRLVPT